MNRVVLLGNAGTGKSTFARRLSKLTNIPVVHSDIIYHSTSWPKTEKEKRAMWRMVWLPIINKDSWIIDGNNMRVLEMILERADTAIFLDYPRYISFHRLIKRRIKYSKNRRPDMPDDWQEKIDFGFWRLVRQFNRTQRPQILDLLNAAESTTEVLIFASPRMLRSYLGQIERDAR